MASSRIDPQGKAYGQMALEMIVNVPKSWAEELAVTKAMGDAVLVELEQIQ